jgi:hypothetical protein
MNVRPCKLTTVFSRVILAAFISLSCLSSSLVYAQNEGRWYQVEILIFKRGIDQLTKDDELWRTDLNLSYPSNARYLKRTLSKNKHELDGHNYTLRKSEQFEVLFHKAWNQQMWAADRSPAWIIRGGQTHGEHRELEGSIRIHIGRYLHVSTDLWLSEFIYDNNAQNSSSSTYPDYPRLPRLPRLPRSSQNSSSNASTADAQEFQRLFSNQPQPVSILTLREKRRMRSKETHYIDHPLMGILVRMLPIDVSSKTPPTAPVQK